MKILSILLAVFILALSGQTCCIDDNCDDESATVATEQADHNDNCNGTCSPFFNCGTCTGFTFQTFTFGISEVISDPFETATVSSYVPQLVPQFNHTIWQPPKIS
ncbi:DUF6660 family protein [Flavobacterium algicola]|uniref:DUF6660 family protein n=1 Tax=Flavobacterium algicola TaxID=556529 RepID=UPI001EFCAFCE|nr:DUF6660 family protein [Flavobacterium algicola]MCG9791261.1 hypothetical protein [Flavobacterium algicola]